MGWGRAAVEQFARSEARVVACARRKDVLERAMETSRRVAAAGATRATDSRVRGDVSRYEPVTIGSINVQPDGPFIRPWTAPKSRMSWSGQFAESSAAGPLPIVRYTRIVIG